MDAPGRRDIAPKGTSNMLRMLEVPLGGLSGERIQSFA